MKSVNGHTICAYPCCVGLDEVRFDNGRFSSVECHPADNDDDDDDEDVNDNDDDDDNDTEADNDRSHSAVDRPVERRPQKQKFRRPV